MSVAVRCVEAWLRGLGAVAIDNLTEVAATARISRSQVWWIHQERTTEDGTPITRDYIEGLITRVLSEAECGAADRFDDAADVFRDVALREEFPTFLTITAYSRYLVETDWRARERMPGSQRSGASACLLQSGRTPIQVLRSQLARVDSASSPTTRRWDSMWLAM